MTKWLYNNERIINDGQPWTDDYGVQHPGNWHVWSPEEKAAHNLVEIIETQQPDSRIYHWGQNPDGTYTSTPKVLDDIDGQKGLRSQFIDQVKEQQQSLLSQTDWAVIRKQDTGAAIPAAIDTYRKAIRAKSVDIRAAIAATKSINDFELLFASGVLQDWPTLEE